MPRPSAASDPREECSFRLRKTSFRTQVHWWRPACHSLSTLQVYRCWYPSVSLSCFYEPAKMGSDCDGVVSCRSASAPFLGITKTMETPGKPQCQAWLHILVFSTLLCSVTPPWWQPRPRGASCLTGVPAPCSRQPGATAGLQKGEAVGLNLQLRNSCLFMGTLTNESKSIKPWAP